MKKLAAALALLAALPVLATSTWSFLSGTPKYVHAVQASNPVSNGVEPAPVGTTTPSEGLGLAGLTDVVVVASTVPGGNMSVSTFAAYWHDPVAAQWVRMPALDLTTSAAPTLSWHVTPPMDYGRLAFEPVAVGTPTVLRMYGAVKTVAR